MGRALPLAVACLTGLACSSGDDAPDALEDHPPFDAAPRSDTAVPADAPPFEPPGPGCGNGTLDEGEECDDGNPFDDDACVRCRRARCGDGFARRVVEPCDDGNLGEEDGCTTLCLQCGAANQFAGGLGHCYTRHDVGLTYAEASRSCGFGHLAVHPTLGTQNVVFDAIQAGTVGPYWIGLNDLRTEATFEWVNFAGLAYTDWNTGEPDGGQNENCVALAVSTSNWATQDCLSVRKFLCEEDGAWVFGQNDHGYRVVWGRGTFGEAVSACTALGGNLATLTTPEEAAVVFAQVPSDPRVRVWIGASDQVTEGTFTWVTSEPFSYAAWVTGEPNGSGDCMVIAADRGGWDDADCGTRRPYACEVN